MSDKAKAIIGWMIQKLSGMKYFYKETVEGCYEAALRYNFKRPTESKEEIVNKVLEIFKEM